MALVILCVAVFNVALGYGLALLLHSPGGMLSGWIEFELPLVIALPGFLRRHKEDIETGAETVVSSAAAAPPPVKPETAPVSKAAVQRDVAPHAAEESPAAEEAPAVADHVAIPDPVFTDDQPPPGAAQISPDDLQVSIGEAVQNMIDAPPVDTGSMASNVSASLNQCVNDLISDWRSRPTPMAHYALALVEPDDLGSAERFGAMAIDASTRVLERTINHALDADQLAMRPTDAAYLLALPGLSARDGVLVVEKIRQQIEALEFQCGEGSFRLSVTCAVIAVDNEQSTEALMNRLSQTLEEAKRYGGNRTFFFDGRHAAPAVPPLLKVEEQLVKL